MYYILAILAALLLSAFQYLYKRKALLLFIIRFLVYALIFLLLLNPKISHKKEIITKPDLYVLADNSLSIKYAKHTDSIRQLIQILKQNNRLNKKFKIHYFKFGKQTHLLDTLQFKDKQTNIAQAIDKILFLSKSDRTTPVLLLSDGQQNFGKDYNSINFSSKKIHIFPVIFSDTIPPQDIHVDLINTNPYAFKDNKFPVEVFLAANLNQAKTVNFYVRENKKILFQKKLQFTPQKKAIKLNFYLPAGKLGTHLYVVSLSPFTGEKNILNNHQYFKVKVIDNKHNILLVSDIIHPDLGAIKRSLETHKNLKIDLTTPLKLPANIRKYESVILYQPNTEFKPVFEIINKKEMPWLIITGTQTDWQFLNRQNLFFNKLTTYSFENYFPLKNKDFSLFKLPSLKVDDFPPLKDFYGQVKLKGIYDIVFYSRINGLNSKQALFAFNSQKRQAVVLGENLWQWRLQAGIEHQIDQFDQLLFQTIQYLSLKKNYDRLKIYHKNIYYQGSPIKIYARFLDKNLSPDLNLTPSIELRSKQKTLLLPLILSGNQYQVTLNDLPPGKYQYRIFDKHANLSKNGQFEILPYNLEQINTWINLPKLRRLAQQTNGQVILTNHFKKALNNLLLSANYKSIVSYKSTEGNLIDYKILLFILLVLLGIEWFIKKLKGSL